MVTGAIQGLALRMQQPVDSSTRRRAGLHLLDWLACACAARHHPSLAAPDALLAESASGDAAICSRGHGTPEAALLLNGMLGNLLEMDDVHRQALLHPGPVVVPAALACCRPDTPGTDLLDALVRGYEAVIGVGMALGPSHYRYWHPTSTCGAFGAAAACASLLGLDAQRTGWALGNAGTRTGGLWQMRHENVPSKSLHNAEAARAGWLAARLAAAGYAGPVSLLDGEQGLFAATSSDADAARIPSQPGPWLIEQVSFKPWPACRHAHPAIDALLALPLLPAADALSRIHVYTYAEALQFCDCEQPVSALQARFSIQHALAAILVHGTPQLAHYEPASLDDARLVALRARIILHEDPVMSAGFPEHFAAAVELEYRDASRQRAAVADAWGDPEWPMDAAAITAKAAALMDWGQLDSAHQQRLFDAVAELPTGSCAALLSALAETA